MKSIKSLIPAVSLFANTSTTFAFDTGDPVYHLQGPNNSSMTISKGRVLSSHGNQVLVRSDQSGQKLSFNNGSPYSTWQGADTYREHFDAGHLSKPEIMGGVALLAIFGIYRAMGECSQISVNALEYYLHDPMADRWQTKR